jgi:hypothetical protein
MATVRREGGANGVFEVPNASTDMNDDARLTGRTRLFACQWNTIALIKKLETHVLTRGDAAAPPGQIDRRTEFGSCLYINMCVSELVRPVGCETGSRVAGPGHPTSPSHILQRSAASKFESGLQTLMAATSAQVLQFFIPLRPGFSKRHLITMPSGQPCTHTTLYPLDYF